MKRKGLHTVQFQSMHFTLRRFSIVVAALALCLVVAGGASARSDNHASSRVSGITVYAASSLTDVFPQIDSGPKYSFAASSTLAAQITQGAPADVFASANTTIPDQLYAKGIVDKPVIFTRNRLVLVVPTSNPAGIHSVYDLKKPGIKLVIAASAVPVGSYTLQVLKQMGLTTSVLANVVSRESDVRERAREGRTRRGGCRLRLLHGREDRPRQGDGAEDPRVGAAQGDLRVRGRLQERQQDGGAGIPQGGPEQGGPAEDARRRLPADPDDEVGLLSTGEGGQPRA